MQKNVGWEAKSNHDGSYTITVNGKQYYCADTHEFLHFLEDIGEKSEYQAKQIYQQALETYGGQLQTFVCMEEMSELQKELCKYERGEDNVEHIAEEIADVRIMLDQMVIMHDCETLVEDYKSAKLARLKERLDSVVPCSADGIDYVIPKEIYDNLAEETAKICDKLQKR